MIRIGFIILFYLFHCNAFSAEGFDIWYNNLSDNEKVAQLFVTGVKSKKLSSSEKNLLSKWPLGGIIYFKRNYSSPEQFLSLHKEILETTKNQLFSFTDQEGGDVVRIGNSYDAPTAMAVGELNSSKVTNYLGRAYGSLLSDLNISSNLAPVVDIRSSKSLDFISTRSLSSDPKTVSNLSLELSKGMLKGGVIPTLKHFPGLGGIETDTHKKQAVKTSSLEKIKNTDWLPYAQHAKDNLAFFVMTSHTKLILDEKDLGIVTYSPEALKLLRETTSSHQVVMTDDLEMGGAQVAKDFKKAALESFLAGHDLILIGWSGKKLLSTLDFFKSQVNEPQFKKRLKESLSRLYSMKQKKLEISKNSSRFTKHGALKLTGGLNSKISDYLLRKEATKIFKRSPASLEEFFFLSSDPVFRKMIRTKNQSSLLSTADQKIHSLCKTQTCILHVTGEKTAKKVNSILKNDASSGKYIILNSADPYLINKKFYSQISMINAYTKSYALGKQLKEILKSYTSLDKKNKSKKIAFQ